jgi:citrate synthase
MNVSRGLEGVVAAETRLSMVDGERGELVIGGVRVEELASWRFEDVVELLWGFPLDHGVSKSQSLRVSKTRGRSLFETLRLHLNSR